VKGSLKRAGLSLQPMSFVVLQALLIGLLTLAELRWPARREPAPRALNLGFWALRLTLQLTALPAIGLTVAAASQAVGAPSLAIGSWPLVWSAVVFLVVMDLAEYLYHRAQHAIPWLWRRHALHHSDPCVSATTTERHWWGDLILKGVLFVTPISILLRPAPADYAVYAAICLWHNVVHANLKLDFGRWSWVLNSPAYHRLHHARAAEHHGANYSALFPIFDVLAGSYRRANGALETGLDVEPGGLVGALTWPPAESKSQQAAVTAS
jgi:sterol desaturase/sphingolipid hydroxylase (fatty acid hydroxylase superfamily)